MNRYRSKWADSDIKYPLIVACFIVFVWVVLYLQRVHAHQPNVDDYLYTILATRLVQHGFVGFFKAALHTGPYAPLYLVLGAPLGQVKGINGEASLELLFLLLISAGAYVLSRTWVERAPAAVIAGIVALNQAVLGWSLMINFALAASTFMIWSFAAYFRSDHLRDFRWSVGFAVSFSALLLSRSLSPVYAAPLVLLVAFDIFFNAQKKARQFKPMICTLVLILLIAGPWWYESGPSTFAYLSSAGYQSSSGFTSYGARLTPSTIFERSKETLSDLGSFESIALVCMLLIAIVIVTFNRRIFDRNMRIIAVWIILTLLVLSTSSNGGSGFGLPIVALIIIEVGAILSTSKLRIPFSLFGMVVIVAGIIAISYGGLNHWWQGPIYREEVLFSGGSTGTNIESVTHAVDALIGNAPTIVARDDDVLNANGLSWVGRNMGIQLIVPPYGPTGTSTAIAELPSAQYLITGTSLAPYHGLLNQLKLQIAATQEHFYLQKQWRIGGSNVIEVWTKRKRL